ncbi:hypothetical protein BAUCODRAFT_517846 [Baudoinia panamericana UAMH 10762]|uniref:DUF1330 domain-containing protein n=1 Tax=Baudoinia panamericana (strain UAMH 10762) TaxID=717646 RepID=M2LNZ7_BAUPA|nr:uncharacterized protein BAUCODRAFT_517846 [Baudoinia panamericana UAMH 10762]EMC96102.1 hypothetical protein BAUCODRAFT_517846 [Baudoinia panamericana UAMH 10762]
MPLTTLHLLALSPNATINQYVRALSSFGVKPFVTSRCIRWVIRPETLSTEQLLNTTWDLLIILPASSPLPEAYLSRDWVSNHWSITAGVPSSLVNDFERRNERLLHPQSGDVPELTGSLEKPRMTSSAQGLELNDELLEWSRHFKLGQNGAVSMLNLLAFKPDMHESYLRYGKAFSESIGKKRGGFAKVVGKVVPKQGTQGEDQAGWDEIALAHYPSIRHFADMIASEDYQEVNHRDRLPSLRDTCILCTSELDPDLTVEKPKL